MISVVAAAWAAVLFLGVAVALMVVAYGIGRERGHAEIAADAEERVQWFREQFAQLSKEHFALQKRFCVLAKEPR